MLYHESTSPSPQANQYINILNQNSILQCLNGPNATLWLCTRAARTPNVHPRSLISHRPLRLFRRSWRPTACPCAYMLWGRLHTPKTPASLTDSCIRCAAPLFPCSQQPERVDHVAQVALVRLELPCGAAHEERKHLAALDRDGREVAVVLRSFMHACIHLLIDSLTH
jgi:hypothetical protein